MKRRTRLIIIGCAIAGTFPTAAQAASASPIVRNQVRIAETVKTVPKAAHTSAALPRVHAPVERVTVRAGDTLTVIAVRTSRTWEQLAAYNRIPNPNLIYVDQVLTVPPANYVPPGVAIPTQVETTSRRETATRTYYTPRVSYAPRVSYTTHAAAPTYTASGVWGCIADHESGGNPATNTGNGYYGMYQDTQASWVEGGGLAYAASADRASAAAQTAVNERIQAQQGWSAWPNTSRMCGA